MKINNNARSETCHTTQICILENSLTGTIKLLHCKLNIQLKH